MDTESDTGLDTGLDIERLALVVARRAAAEIEDTARETYRVTRKSTEQDLLTEADLRSESVIMDLLRTARPDDAVLAEESGYQAGRSGVTWIVDPLDGTANFVRASPHYAVSVAAVSGERWLASVIVRPADGQWMATLDGSLDGSFTRSPGPAERHVRVAVALPYGAEELKEAHGILRLVGRRYQVVRTGSAACDLLRVAARTLDAHIAVALPWWDTAAGHGLVRAGGGTVTRGRSLRRTRIDIAGEPAVVRALLGLLTEHRHVVG
ncbi:inositol monophosphatase [Streptosporangium sp. NPDC020145]|uniref:inositol monophosphatase family protein n=1 Tax=Streptosporangium sp. NPDC020145 TaxID=3154694 RepID=UPI003424E233